MELTEVTGSTEFWKSLFTIKNGSRIGSKYLSKERRIHKITREYSILNKIVIN